MPPTDLTLVYRLERESVVDVDTLAAAIGTHHAAASSAGQRPVGVEIDFDAPRRRLPEYTQWLTRLRPAKVIVV